MRDVHPTSTAKGGGQIGEESNKVYCKQCGFPCDLDRDKQGAGDGIILVETTDGSYTYYNPTVNNGCPFCGSRNYH